MSEDQDNLTPEERERRDKEARAKEIVEQAGACAIALIVSLHSYASQLCRTNGPKSLVKSKLLSQCQREPVHAT